MSERTESLVICVATMVDRCLNISSSQFPDSVDVEYVFSVQGVADSAKEELISNYIASFFVDSPFKVVFCKKVGLSANRNFAVSYVSNSFSGYVYIADDDIQVCLENIRAAVSYSVRGKVDVLVGEFMKESEPSKFVIKKQRDEKKLKPADFFSVSSVELLIWSGAFIDEGLSFDTDFGLGTVWPSGEELILLADCWKKKLVLVQKGFVFCKHPAITSGTNFYTSENLVEAKGAMLFRAFGVVKGGLLCLMFSLKKYPKYRNHISFYSFVYSMYIGFFKFKNSLDGH